MEHKVSMQDIADYVGVSKVTVSKVLRGQIDIGEQTRSRILETAQSMGYVYKRRTSNPSDLSFSKITVITADHYLGRNDSFYVKVFKLLSDHFDKLKVDTKLLIQDYQSETNLEIPEALRNQNTDGLIVMGQFSRAYLKEIQKLQIPMVFLDFYYDDFPVTSVCTDNFYGAYELTNHLIKRGHRKIGFVGKLNFTSSIQDRFLGYYKSLLEYTLPVDMKWILEDRTADGRWIEIPLPEEMPTAFVCNCDEVALSLMGQFKSRGIRVPEDVSVVGFDDTVHAVHAEPKLTTMHVNAEDLVDAAIRAMTKTIEHSSPENSRILIKAKMIKRQSVAAIPESVI